MDILASFKAHSRRNTARTSLGSVSWPGPSRVMLIASSPASADQPPPDLPPADDGPSNKKKSGPKRPWFSRDASSYSTGGGYQSGASSSQGPLSRLLVPSCRARTALTPLSRLTFCDPDSSHQLFFLVGSCASYSRGSVDRSRRGRSGQLLGDPIRVEGRL